MNIDYAWALNKEKLGRAIREVRGDNLQTGENGRNAIEEGKVKAAYLRMGGLVSIAGAETRVKMEEKKEEELAANVPVPEPMQESEVAAVTSPAPVPKKRGGKRKVTKK